MNTEQKEQGQPVAYLWFHETALQWKDLFEISVPADFSLGRLKPFGDTVPWCSDPTISNQHLRIHAIAYEKTETCEILPLVYAEDLSSNGTCIRKRTNNPCDEIEPQLHRMPRGVAVLLEDCDELRLSPTLKVTYCLAKPANFKTDQFSELQLAEQKIFSQRYIITNRKLGVGGHGGVYLAWNHPAQRQLACKIIKRTGNQQAKVSSDVSSKRIVQREWERRERDKKQFRETQILQELNHPNVISLEKVFWSDQTIYIFSELITAGDLFSFLEYKGGVLDDVDAAVIIRQILKALEYLHSHDIVLRDLKPDNVLMTSLADGARVVLTDFGQARYIPGIGFINGERKTARYRMTSVIGTADYVAPEVYYRNDKMSDTVGYSEAVDMWSVGSVTALLLSGSHIFDPESKRASGTPMPGQPDPIIAEAAKCDLRRMDRGPEWAGVGSRPKNFIRRLLVLDEARRMTAAQALKHEWFTNRHHKAEYEALYERAIRHWRPRKKTFSVAEYLSPDKIQIDRRIDAVTCDQHHEHDVSQFFTRAACQARQQKTRTPWLATGELDDNIHASPPMGPSQSDTTPEQRRTNWPDVAPSNSPAPAVDYRLLPTRIKNTFRKDQGCDSSSKFSRLPSSDEAGSLETLHPARKQSSHYCQGDGPQTTSQAFTAHMSPGQSVDDDYETQLPAQESLDPVLCIPETPPAKRQRCSY